FYGIQILKRDAKPWRTVQGIEFRSVTIEAFKGKQGECFERNQAVIYRGPFKEVLDDDNHRMVRGKRYAVCDKTYNLYKKAPYREFLEFVDPIVDLTGGAPEMIPDFRYFVERVKALRPSRHVIDRCNLTILLERGYEDLPQFLARKRVEIIASMPCYSPKNVNAQRGEGVFEGSIAALKLLNRLGYGMAGDLPLHLVYNPVGPFLSPP